MATSSTAYARNSKPLTERKQPRIEKSSSKIEPKKIGVGLVAGCCLALLTYLSLAKLFSIYSPVFDVTVLSASNSSPSISNSSSSPNLSEPKGAISNENMKSMETDNDPVLDIPVVPKDTEKVQVEATLRDSNSKTDENNGKETPKGKTESKIACDENGKDEGFPYARPTVCEMTGDLRISPKEKSVFLVSSSQQSTVFDQSGEKKVRPYARKDDFLLPSVVEVTVKSVKPESDVPKCTKKYNVPAVIFSVAGYTGNFFHDMSDVLIPLFLTTSHFKGEVQYFITNYKPWWVHRYQPLLSKLSNYDVINFDEDEEVHCFPHSFLGLIRDRDLIIYPNPTRNPRNYSMVNFTKFLRDSLSLKRDRPIILGESLKQKPRMLIISRAGTRKLLNQKEVAAMAEGLGFQVIIKEASPDQLQSFAELVNSCDVLLAVHGAGITNQIFLPTEAVMVQIVPWGKMDWMATNFYGQPARDMKLRYVEYYIDKDESTLIEKYPSDHIVFTDPMAIHAQGWGQLAEIIMKQDVKVNLTRFRPSLLEALDLLQE
ncbi:beta-1,2-xylosyltransferease XAX1-like isoform X2 [Carex rostrata]